MSPVNINHFVYSFSIWIAFISSTYLHALTSTMLSISLKSGHPLLVIHFKEKLSNLHL